MIRALYGSTDPSAMRLTMNSHLLPTGRLPAGKSDISFTVLVAESCMDWYSTRMVACHEFTSRYAKGCL